MFSLDAAAVKARKFVKSKGYTFPVYLRIGILPAPFYSSSIPFTIIPGSDGKVAARYDGIVEYDIPEFMAPLELLAGKRAL